MADGAVEKATLAGATTGPVQGLVENVEVFPGVAMMCHGLVFNMTLAKSIFV